MGIVRKTEQAEADLINIWLYISDDDPIAADRYLDGLEIQFNNLSDFPEIGSVKDSFKVHWPDLSIRLWPTEDYVIIYEIIND